ncbi:MAG: macro domain-containing protein [Spirochaetia bacterium]|jgi:O-acetyl-ADP-ribose deacetylase (regulator of RNase III)|nr:macro domain-containing protein [Spirochaetia bacterium]
MIRYLEGDLFKSPAQVIVNTVNTVGVMGKGIALEYKKRYPDMFEKYRNVCEKRQLQIGKLMLWYAPDHWILLFPTKEHWRKPSRMEYIEEGLMKFVRTYSEKHIVSIAFPRLGCGNGELKWEEVKPLMEKYLEPLPIDVYIYLGKNETVKPEHKNQAETIKWLRQHAKDLSFNGVKDDIIHSRKDLFTPYSFGFDGDQWSAEWDNGLKFFRGDSNDFSILVPEDNFRELWDEIRTQSFVLKDEKKVDASLIYALLNSLGYLSEVRIKEKNTEKMIDGYQLNEGVGRVFSFKED